MKLYKDDIHLPWDVAEEEEYDGADENDSQVALLVLLVRALHAPGLGVV